MTPLHLRPRLRALRHVLWLKPLAYCMTGIALALLAAAADALPPTGLPDIAPGTIQTLLSIITSSMLAVATLVVASMLSAYATASQTTTPRAFALMLEDDVTKIALSSFIGAFIFAVVGTIAVRTELYGPSGRLTLFVLTLMLLGWVILTFLRWVDRIARLGQLSFTIDRADAAARASIERHRRSPALGCAAPEPSAAGERLTLDRAGFAQNLDLTALQGAAEAHDLTLTLLVRPGDWIDPGRPVLAAAGAMSPDAAKALRAAILIGPERTFDGDPRFGLVVLSEIASRALSPGINDPGTAVMVIGRVVRLLALWAAPGEAEPVRHDRLRLAPLGAADLFDAGLTSIARDGAGLVEVGLRLQAGLAALAGLGDGDTAVAARSHARGALARAERALSHPADLERVRAAAGALERR